MNQLITDIFGDPYITLNCASGECMRRSEVPGFMVSKSSRLSTNSLLTLSPYLETSQAK